MNFTQIIIEQLELHAVNSIVKKKEKIKCSNLNVFFIDDIQRHKFDHEINKNRFVLTITNQRKEKTINFFYKLLD